MTAVAALPAVAPLRPEDEGAWEAFVASHPDATVYHSLAWRAVTVAGLGHRPHYLLARGAAGEVAGVLPLFLVRGLFGRRLVSVPMRDRGGVLAADEAAAAALVAHAVELTRELGCRYLELRSLGGVAPAVASAYGLRGEPHWVTTRVDLTPGPAALWKALDRDAVRWAIRKVQRDGVRAEADDSVAGVERFYELFVRTRLSMGIPPFPKALFLAVHRELIARGLGNLVVVWKGDQPINAMISLFSHGTFLPAYAAPQREWRKSYPSEVMFWHTMEWAAEHGFHTYDFGADSPHQEGLLRFKSKWGGRQHPMHYEFLLHRASTPPNFDSSSRAFTLARRVWARIPPAVARPLGAWVTRQLS